MKNNKKWILSLLVAGFVFTIGCAQGQATQENNNITESAAREIALEQVGLDTATFTKQEYDATDNDYEFEFHANGTEYEFEIDAATGTIKDYNVEEVER